MHVQSCCLYKPLAFFPFSMQISRSSRLRRGRQENGMVEMDYQDLPVHLGYQAQPVSLLCN